MALEDDYDEEYEVDENGVLYTDEEIIEPMEYAGEIIIKLIAPNCKRVNEMAFQYCKGLQSVDIPNCTDIDGYAFLACKRLKEINMPKMQQIGYNAFMDCKNLTSVDIPNCIKIYDEAFEGCTNLTDINIPDDVEIGRGVFWDTPLEDEF